MVDYSLVSVTPTISLMTNISSNNKRFLDNPSQTNASYVFNRKVRPLRGTGPEPQNVALGRSVPELDGPVPTRHRIITEGSPGCLD